MNLTMYHNPRCSKSRKTLEILRERGLQPRIVEYLREPPDGETLLRLARLLGVSVKELVRDKEAENAGGLPPGSDDEKLARWLAEHPAAMQRPIVVDEEQDRAVIGRPPENVDALLPPA